MLPNKLSCFENTARKQGCSVENTAWRYVHYKARYLALPLILFALAHGVNDREAKS
jgi:hypothetical protein